MRCEKCAARERVYAEAIRTDLRQEFSGYNGAKLVKDILAGLTVAAVALPLALAFGVSSGRTPPRG
jgi:SulP family sulfate permease